MFYDRAAALASFKQMTRGSSGARHGVAIFRLRRADTLRPIRRVVRLVQTDDAREGPPCVTGPVVLCARRADAGPPQNYTGTGDGDRK